MAVLSVYGDAPQTDRTGNNGKPNVDWGDHDIDGVPCLMVMHEYEWSDDRIMPAFAFLAKHPATPMALLADAGHGHFDYSDDLVSLLALFIRNAAEQRLPAEAGGPLRPIDPTKGWRTDVWRHDNPPAVPAAPYGDYKGNPADAFWCFDQSMAEATEAYYARARGKKPQLAGFLQDGAQAGQKESASQIDLNWQPLADGITFKVHARFLDIARRAAKTWRNGPACLRGRGWDTPAAGGQSWFHASSGGL